MEVSAVKPKTREGQQNSHKCSSGHSQGLLDSVPQLCLQWEQILLDKKNPKDSSFEFRIHILCMLPSQYPAC